jgi:hypothetical protein
MAQCAVELLIVSASKHLLVAGHNKGIKKWALHLQQDQAASGGLPALDTNA